MSENTEATTTTTEPSDAELRLAKATEIAIPMHNDGKDEEEILEALVPAMKDAGMPVKFKQGYKLIRLALQGAGFALSAKERQEQAEVLIADAEAPEDWDGVVALADEIADQVDDTTQGQAIACIKKFAKKHELELPTKPKAATGPGGARGFRGIAFDWMVEHAGESREELAEFIKGHGKKESDVQRLTTIYDMALKVAVKLGGEIPVTE